MPVQKIQAFSSRGEILELAFLAWVGPTQYSGMKGVERKFTPSWKLGDKCTNEEVLSLVLIEYNYLRGRWTDIQTSVYATLKGIVKAEIPLLSSFQGQCECNSCRGFFGDYPYRSLLYIWSDLLFHMLSPIFSFPYSSFLLMKRKVPFIYRFVKGSNPLRGGGLIAWVISPHWFSAKPSRLTARKLKIKCSIKAIN